MRHSADNSSGGQVEDIEDMSSCQFVSLPITPTLTIVLLTFKNFPCRFDVVSIGDKIPRKRKIIILLNLFPFRQVMFNAFIKMK